MAFVIGRNRFDLQELREAGDQEDHVRAIETGRAALGGGQQGVYDVPEQIAPGGLPRQGALSSRREHSCERAHSEQ